MSDTPPTGLELLVGARGKSTTGYEIAHFAAQDMYARGFVNFISLGKDDAPNLRPLPNKDRGALIFNVTKHARHVDAVNDIIFGITVTVH